MGGCVAGGLNEWLAGAAPGLLPQADIFQGISISASFKRHLSSYSQVEAAHLHL